MSELAWEASAAEGSMERSALQDRPRSVDTVLYSISPGLPSPHGSLPPQWLWRRSTTRLPLPAGNSTMPLRIERSYDVNGGSGSSGGSGGSLVSSQQRRPVGGGSSRAPHVVESSRLVRAPDDESGGDVSGVIGAAGAVRRDLVVGAARETELALRVPAADAARLPRGRAGAGLGRVRAARRL
jgi:hypothetical protein